MPKPNQDKINSELAIIQAAMVSLPDGASAEEIIQASGLRLIPRTMHRRLQILIDRQEVKLVGEKRAAKYFLVNRNASPQNNAATASAQSIQLSAEALRIRNEVSKPLHERKQVEYNRSFLDQYRPNIDYYLSKSERERLAKATATPGGEQQPAGTYAKHILQRLLIDLSWNSSRLEGNTYSLLDTERLLAQGQEAPGKSEAEAQMILNHKDAIEFLVSGAGEIGFNRHTVLNLHGLLANDLLPDPAAPGRLRSFAVGIRNSSYTPTPIPQLIEEMFELILAKAAAITDPHEQAFFVMVHLPYLQPFDDVNKRVSRLAANIPLIEHNMIPLSFVDVPEDLYIRGLLGVYELNRVELLKDVFLWACERSADRYAMVRQTVGEPNPFRMKYRKELQRLVAEIVSQNLSREDAALAIQASALRVPEEDQARFRELVETELLSLHEGNFVRYRVSPAEFRTWKSAWSKT
jgi:hypothetical protein